MDTRPTKPTTLLPCLDGAAPAGEPCRTWPKREFLDPGFYQQVRDSAAPVVVERACTRGLREGMGFLATRDGGLQQFSCNSLYGCAFNCTYCYVPKMMILHHGGRGMDLWGRYVFVKTNFVHVLQRDLKRLHAKGILDASVVRVSSTTDVYQPAELRYRLMRGVLKAFAATPPKWIFLQTKSTAFTRDLDLLEPLKDRLVTCVTITTDRDDIARTFEPRAPSIADRLRAIELLARKGFKVEVMVAPVLPQDSYRLARLLDPLVSQVFVKTFWETGKRGNQIRPDAKKIVFDGGFAGVLAPGVVDETCKVFSEVLGKERVHAGKDGFLSLDVYR